MEQLKRLGVIAETGVQFASFGPYVASINAGRVAFQATMADGNTAIVVGDGTGENRVVFRPPAPGVCSHPDIDARGRVCAYVTVGDTTHVVSLDNDGDEIWRSHHLVAGPLGPTVNDAGTIALRGRHRGQCGVWLRRRAEDPVCIASTERFASFDGLPLLDENDFVFFRATQSDGRQGIYQWNGGAPVPVIETGERFQTLGRFPALGRGNTVLTIATETSGRAGAYRIDAATVTPLATTDDGFSSFRSILEADGSTWFCATPIGGELGLYRAGWAHERMLAVGDWHGDSTISNFALNPVSINRHGKLVVRLDLADGRQQVVRIC